MRSIYLDSGALVKLYIVESGSSLVQDNVARADILPLNPLQSSEVQNAILAAHGRGFISAEAMEKTLDNFSADIRAGYFMETVPDWEAVWHRAMILARRHTRTILCRTLDILHVAIADLSDVDEMLTGDRRQHQLGQAIGLPTSLIEADK